MANPNVAEFNDGNFSKDVLGHTQPVLVDFWAPWCGPCRMVGPIVEELANEFAGKVKVGKLNTDDNPIVPTSLNIQGIPTLILFKDGKVFDRMVGAAPKGQLKAFIEKSLA